MRTACLCLLVGLFSLCYAPVSLAEPEKDSDGEKKAAEAFKLRPFNEHLDWDEARVLVGKGLKGDEEARTEIEKGGLSYISLLTNIRGASAVNWTYSLLSRHKDWIEAMQKWERVVLRNDTSAMAKMFEDLKPRFENWETQLARIILRAWRLGDEAALKKLLAIKTDSLWVKTVRAHCGIGMNPREAALALVESMPAIRDQNRKEFGFWPAYFDEDMRATADNNKRFIDASLSMLYDLEGVELLRQLPHEWGWFVTAERIGALAAETGDRKFVSEIAAKYAEYCGEGYQGQERYCALSAAAGLPLPKSYGELQFDHVAGKSAGPCISAWAAQNASRDGFELENALASIVALYGNPDLNASRVFCLKLCLASPDEAGGNLAARSVLALRDDRLDGIHNVLWALSQDKHWAVKAAEFAKILEKSGSPKLVELARLAAKGELPERPPESSEKLGLGIEQRAALLAPFVDKDELASHGGATGVYWLNRAIFLEAGGAHVAASEAFSAAACVQAALTGRKRGNVNSIFWLDFVGRRYGEPMRARLFEQHKQAWPDLKSIIEAEIALGEDEQAPLSERAFYIAHRAVNDGKPVPDKVVTLLQGDLSLGGGMGLLLVSRAVTRSDGAAGWRKVLARAHKASPLDMDVAFSNGPTSEGFGVCRYGHFEGASHSALVLALIQPDATDTLMRAAEVIAMQGTPGVALSAMYLSAARGSLPRFVHGNGWARPNLYLPASDEIGEWLKQVCRTWGDEIPAASRKAVSGQMRAVNWHSGGVDTAWHISYFSLRPHFLKRGLQTLAVYYNMQDVNNLLNFSLAVARHDPERVLRIVQRSEELGVSNYGRFVGAQSTVRSYAALGQFDQAMKVYRDFRGKDVGNPPNLDRYLLLGFAEGNQYKDLDKAFKIMADYEAETSHGIYAFGYRRALMAAGKHAEVVAAKVPVSDKSFNMTRAGEYSKAFHEARAMLEREQFAELLQAAEKFTKPGSPAKFGEIVDAAILQALADKELEDALGTMDENGRIHVLEASWLEYWFDAGQLLDYAVCEILAGKRNWDDLPKVDSRHYWHGARFAERPSIHNGSGFLSAAECEARDLFMRGMLAFLHDKKEKAKELLEACIAKDQRFSHEYHVSEWVIQKRLKVKPEEKK